MLHSLMQTEILNLQGGEFKDLKQALPCVCMPDNVRV